MPWLSKPSLAALLDDERAKFEALSNACFQIEEEGPYQATMRSELLTIGFGGLRNDRDFGADIELAQPQTSAGAWLWAKFLGEEIPPKPRDRHGCVTTPTDEQVRDELELVDRLVREVFRDPQKAREAAYFVRGYNRAYNDYCVPKADDEKRAD